MGDIKSYKEIEVKLKAMLSQYRGSPIYITDVKIDDSGKLIVSLSNGDTYDAGSVLGEDILSSLDEIYEKKSDKISDLSDCENEEQYPTAEAVKKYVDSSACDDEKIIAALGYIPANQTDVERLLHECPEIKYFTAYPNLTVELGREIYPQFDIRLSRRPRELEVKKGSKILYSDTYDGNVEEYYAIIVKSEESISETSTFTLILTDEYDHEIKQNSTVTFCNKVYYGVGYEDTEPTTQNEKLQTGKAITFTVTAGENEYIYYSCPTRYGTPVFKVGGFEGGFSRLFAGLTLDTPNSSGYTEPYQLWRSENANLGTVTVTVT